MFLLLILTMLQLDEPIPLSLKYKSSLPHKAQSMVTRWPIARILVTG